MGRLSGTLLGFPRGKAGDIIFRVRNGKPHFYACPVKSGEPSSPKEEANRRRFSCCASFCAALLKSRAIRTVWEDTSTGGDSVYNKMIKINLPRLGSDYAISDLLLSTSENKFDMNIISAVLQSTCLTVISGIYPYNISGEKRISMQGVLQLLQPADTLLKPFRFIPLHTKDIDLVSGVNSEFMITFDDCTSQLLTGYSVKKLLLNFIIKDFQGMPERCSKEIYVEGI